MLTPTALHLSRRRRLLLGLGATLLTVTLPLVSLITGQRTAMYSDVNEDHGPLTIAAWRAIRHGHFPVWSGLLFGGHNFFAAGQSGSLYPPNALFGWLHPVTAFRWWFLFHVWLAAAGAFAWSWHRWRSVPGAVVSGVAYGLNGFIVLHVVHMPLVAMAAWLPFAFLGLDLVIERWSLARAGLLAGSLSAVAFTGHPQGLWQLSIGLGIVAAVQLVRSGRGPAAWARTAAAGLIGLGSSAVLTLPVYLFSRTSVRSRLSMDRAFAYSTEPRFLLTFGSPRILGRGLGGQWGSTFLEQANFVGVSVIALAVIGVVQLGRDRRSVALLVMSAFGLLTALGGHTPVGRIVYAVVPLAGGFQAWARNLVLVDVAVACLAGAGVRAVLATADRWRRPLLVATLAVAVGLAVLPALTDLGGAIARDADRALALGGPIAILLVLVGTVALVATRHRAGAGLLVLLCSLEMVAFAVSAPWTSDGGTPAQVTRFYDAAPPSIGAPADAPGGVDRWVSQTGEPRGVSLVKGYQGVNGYDPLLQADFAEVAAGMTTPGALRRPDFAEPGWLSDVLRVTTLILDRRLRPTDPRWQRDRSLLGGQVRWIRVPRLAEATLVNSARTATVEEIPALLKAPSTDLTQLAYVDPGSDLERFGLDTAPADATPVGQSVTGAMGAHGWGRFAVVAGRPALLVISTTWLDGWHATVDGTAVPVMRANGVVVGVPVPAGSHTVVLHFTPPGLWLGGVVSVVSVAALFVPSLAGAWRRRPRSSRRSPASGLSG